MSFALCQDVQVLAEAFTDHVWERHDMDEMMRLQAEQGEYTLIDSYQSTLRSIEAVLLEALLARRARDTLDWPTGGGKKKGGKKRKSSSAKKSTHNITFLKYRVFNFLHKCIILFSK